MFQDYLQEVEYLFQQRAGFNLVDFDTELGGLVYELLEECYNEGWTYSEAEAEIRYTFEKDLERIKLEALDDETIKEQEQEVEKAVAILLQD